MSPLCFQSCFYKSVVPEFIAIYFIWYWLVDPYHNPWLPSAVSVHCTVNSPIVFILFVPWNFFVLSVITEILILFSFTILSKYSSFSPGPLIFHAAYSVQLSFSLSSPLTLLAPILIYFPHPCSRLNKICPASFRENCQWLKFPLNGLPAQSRVRPVVGLLPLASGPVCLGMAFPPFLVKQLYRSDSVVISSFVRTGYTARRRG